MSNDVFSEGNTEIYELSNLTRLQFLYWAAQKLRPESPFLSVVFTFRIFGEVQVPLFRRAFQALVDHNDALRTVIVDTDGVPQRQVMAEFPFELEFVDFCDQPEVSNAFQSWLDPRKAFPLEMTSCLFDSALVKLATHEFVWYFNQHHLITDAFSVFLCHRRLAAFYEMAIQDEPLTNQFPSFDCYADYERKYRKSAEFDKARQYWQQKLTPGPEPLVIYGSPPGKRSTRVSRITHDLGRERSHQLRKVAVEEGVYSISEDYSLYNIFAALFFVQLHYMSGNRRLGFVTPVHNRFTPAFRDTAGLLMEICPLQVEITEEDSFLSMINKVNCESRESMSHYQNGSSLSLQNNSFDVMFNMHHFPLTHLGGAAVDAQRIHPGHGSESLALHVNDKTESGELILHFDFHQDVFTSDMQLRVVQEFTDIVDRFLADRTQSIALTSAEDRLFDTEHSGISRPPSPLGRAIVAPRDQLEQQLLRIWEAVLEITPISVEDDFFDLGGSSFLAIHLFTEIENELGKKIPMATLLSARTIAAQALLLRKDNWETPRSLVVPIQVGGSKPPFYCVHGFGGGIIGYHELSQHLGPEQPFFGILARGHGTGEEPDSQMEVMAARYASEMRKHQPAGPYFLGGYCYGGIVAFEVARQLRKRGEKVAFVGIFEGSAPNRVGERLPLWHKARIAYIMQEMPYWFRSYWSLGYKKIWRRILRNSRMVWKRVGQRFRKDKDLKRLPEDYLDDDLSDVPAQIRKIFDNQLRAHDNYFPQPFDGRISLFRAPHLTIKQALVGSFDEEMGWGDLAADGVEVIEIAGEHNTILEQPHVSVLANQLKSALERAQQEAVGGNKNSAAFEP